MIFMVDEGKITDLQMLNVAWASLLEDLIGRELSDDEFFELERLLKATCRLARQLPDGDLEED